jgi:hypothetical protein
MFIFSLLVLRVMKNWPFILLLFSCLLVTSCKGKKANLAEGDKIEAGDFIGFFPEAKLPLQLSDSSFHHKEHDSAVISYAVVNQFVPDSFMHAWFGRAVKPRFYPAGRASIKKQETYLFAKAISSAAKTALVLVFDKDKKFVTGMPLFVLDKDAGTRQSAAMDNRYTITTNVMSRSPEGRAVYRKSAYVYNSAGVFTLILTESNDAAASRTTIINPIDTLPKKNKLSGDYMQNRRNLVSIRDGRRPGQFIFYVHFEKDGGTCTGDLKGDARVVAPGKAVFHQQGDPCVINFHFAGNAVTIHEEEGCGSHRDIKCFFDGRFIRKHPVKKTGKRK